MKKKKLKQKITLLITTLLLLMTFTSTIMFTSAQQQKNERNININQTNKIILTQKFSEPIIEREKTYSKIIVEEANSYLPTFGAPKLPLFKETIELPWGTEIEDISYNISDVENKDVFEKVLPVLSFKTTDLNTIRSEEKLNMAIYNNSELFPQTWTNYYTGVGLNKNLEHVKFLTFDIYPVRYNPEEKTIKYIRNITIEISYTLHNTQDFKKEKDYNLVIITSSDFYEESVDLVNHKNSYNLKTNLTTVEEIYKCFPGQDKPEKIKYFIKHTVENWNTSYILLIGDLKEIPIRSTDAYPWRGFGDNILSDLYYADLYDENYSFCSWDSNLNGTFGEVNYNMSSFPPLMKNIDDVDLYPDVIIGRLPCRNTEEVKRMVQKIITYETETYQEEWFKKIILAGGDTFPLSKGSAPFVYEGEIVTNKIAELTPDFKHIFLHTSKRTLHPLTFNWAINQGAGFLSYSGHGFEHGWGTYRPNAIRDGRLIFYFTPFLQFLRNQDKMPIVFFDACLTAKLDFNMSSLENYYTKFVKILKFLTGVEYDNTNYFPCFAYQIINQENGGAIASIGATRPAYSLVDNEGIYAGAGPLNVYFFDSYKEGITLGEMFLSSQLDYIHKVAKDYFTIEEFLIVGDPTLKVGGYPN